MAKGKKEYLSLEDLLEQAVVKEEEQPYEVPSNWVWTRLGNLSQVKGGKRLPKGHFLIEEKTDCPYIRVTDFKELTIDVDNVKYLNKDTQKLINNYTISCEDVYISIAGTIGKVGIIPIELDGANLTENAAKITQLSGTDKKYLMYLLKSDQLQHQIKDSTLATTQAKLALFRIAEFKVPLPPLAEQQRIVERLESLFEKLDAAKELVQNALDSFENRKAAILHKAFTGELTAKWREENGVSFDSWEKKPFKEFCLLKRGYDLPAQSRISGEYPLVSSSGIIDTHNERKVQGPGIVTGRSGTIGRVHYIENDFWPLNTTLYSQKLFGNVPKYIYYYLMTFDFKTYSSSTAVPTLNRNLFLDVPIKVPNIREQEEIVCILDKLLASEQQAQELCNIIEKIDLMKKAILARAFRGELGTNNPEEESAIELLKEVLKEKL